MPKIPLCKTKKFVKNAWRISITITLPNSDIEHFIFLPIFAKVLAEQYNEPGLITSSTEDSSKTFCEVYWYMLKDKVVEFIEKVERFLFKNYHGYQILVQST